MEQSLKNLLDQKFLINQIDSFIYSTFLKKEDIENLLHLCKMEKADLENLLNRLHLKTKVKETSFFAEYVKFREKYRDEERLLFTKIFQKIGAEEVIV